MCAYDRSQRIELNEQMTDSGLEWTLLVAGDFCAINRFTETRQAEDQVGQTIVQDLHDLIAQADIAIVNMEGPVRTSSAPISKLGHVIQVDGTVPSVLKQIGFDVVSLANNHVMDYGSQALHSTIEACQEEDLRVCGAGVDIHAALKAVERVVSAGVRATLLAFCELEFGIADHSEPDPAWISHPLALKRITAAAQTADVVITYLKAGSGIEAYDVG